MPTPDLNQLIAMQQAPPSADTAKVLAALGSITVLLEILVRLEIGYTWEEVQRDLGVKLQHPARPETTDPAED